ncbi:acyl-CoA synthetase [Roseovarius sp.]|uniref:acyl-CoA synthetase n=1 Tax=Roseovarius sp. TaxID=1486281 RepID=UPI003A98505D
MTVKEKGAETPFADFDWQIPHRFNFATDVVDRWAEERDGPCLIWEDASGARRDFSYDDMSRLTKRVGHALQAAGISKGDRVLVVLPRIPEWQIAMVAALRIGAVPIPCIEMLTAAEIRYRADHSGAQAVICRAGHADRIEAGLGRVPLRFSVGPRDGWDDITAFYDRPDEAEDALVMAEDPVLLYYTSGSTGYPKGVLHAARGLYAWRYSARHWLDVRPGDRIWCTADTGWSKAGTSVLFGPWSEGGCAFMYDGPFDPAERLSLLARHKITIYCAPATELNRVVQEDVAAYDLTALRRTVSAGEAMNPIVAEQWRAVSGLNVAEAYGQTETLMTALTVTGIEPRIGSMGISAPGSTLSIVDDAGTELPPGEVGHVALKLPNPQFMLGYWNAPGALSGAIVDGPAGRWFLTGDLGSRDAEGYFWYSSRSDDVINSAGYRIGPTEVENAVLEHGAVLECAVVAAPDPKRGEVVKAFIVLKDGVLGDDTLVKAIQDHVKLVASPYKYPRLVDFCSELPKGPTGKILRRALREREWSRQEPQS